MTQPEGYTVLISLDGDDLRGLLTGAIIKNGYVAVTLRVGLLEILKIMDEVIELDQQKGRGGDPSDSGGYPSDSRTGDLDRMWEGSPDGEGGEGEGSPRTEDPPLPA